MPAYVVLDVDVKDLSVFEQYKQLAPRSIAAYGGRYLARGGANQSTLEGGWTPKRLVILEFPSVERAKAWTMSEEYRPAKLLRQTCATVDMVVVAGLET